MVAGRNGRHRLALIFACIVTGAWTASFLLAIAIDTYDPPRELTPLTFLIAGWLYREAIGKKAMEENHEHQ